MSPALDFGDEPAKWTATAVATAVRGHYGCEGPGDDRQNPNEWAALEEFTLAPGMSSGARIDLFMVRAWSGRPKGHERHGIEIKVTRQDLRRELAHPGKSLDVRRVCHRFYLATPLGLTEGIDLPDGWGLLEVTPRGVRQARSSPRVADPDPVNERTFVEAFRRAARAEARVRTAATGDAPALAARLGRENDSLARRLRTAETARDAEQKRVKALLQLFAAAAGTGALDVPCRCGGGLLIPRRGSNRDMWRGGILYDHRSPERACSTPEPDYRILADRLDEGFLTP